MRPPLLLLPLLLCCAAPVCAADDPADNPPNTLAPPEAPEPETVDELAAWRSPVTGPLLTDGEYRMIRAAARRHFPLRGTHGQELVVVPFETGSGDPALSIAVITRGAHGYRSRLLANVLRSELHSVQLLRLGSSAVPKVVVAEQGGSGGFLTLRVFGASRNAQWRTVWTMPGVYQGKIRFQPETARVQRHIGGEVDAYPKGVWRETYVWRHEGFHLASRQRVRLKTPPGPGDSPHSLHAHAVD